MGNGWKAAKSESMREARADSSLQISHFRPCLGGSSFRFYSISITHRKFLERLLTDLTKEQAKKWISGRAVPPERSCCHAARLFHEIIINHRFLSAPWFSFLTLFYVFLIFLDEFLLSIWRSSQVVNAYFWLVWKIDYILICTSSRKL